MALNLGNLLAGAARAASLNAMQQAFAPAPPPVYTPPPAPQYSAPALDTMQQAFSPVADVARQAVMQAAAAAPPSVPAPPPPPSFFATMQKALAANPMQGFAGSSGDLPMTRAAGGNPDFIPPDKRTVGNWIGTALSPLPADPAGFSRRDAWARSLGPNEGPIIDAAQQRLFWLFGGNPAMSASFGAKQAVAQNAKQDAAPAPQPMVYEDGSYSLPAGVDPIQVMVTVQNPVTGATQQVPVSTLATWVNNGWSYVGGSERVTPPNTEKRGQRKE